MSQKLSARALRAAVVDIVQAALRGRPYKVRRRGGGLTNLVYQADLNDRSVIVRINADPLKLKVFEREKHAMTLARSAGLPIPRVLQVGADPHPFMVQEHVSETVGTHAYDRIDTVRQMGEITARIHRSSCPGLGRRQSTQGRVHAYLGAIRGARTSRVICTHQSASRLWSGWECFCRTTPKRCQILLHMFTWRRNPVLHHGDMRLKNIIVDQHGSIAAVLDWELHRERSGFVGPIGCVARSDDRRKAGVSARVRLPAARADQVDWLHAIAQRTELRTADRGDGGAR